MARIAVSMIVRGRVQGVGYRWWALTQAQRLGLDGWVRNRSDGSVEILAIGEQDLVAQLAKACGQGPSAARVTDVVQAPADDDGSSGFRERATL